jgi:hypothetical protein
VTTAIAAVAAAGFFGVQTITLTIGVVWGNWGTVNRGEVPGFLCPSRARVGNVKNNGPSLIEPINNYSIKQEQAARYVLKDSATGLAALQSNNRNIRVGTG